MATTASHDKATTKVTEKITVHKYDGEPPAEGEHKDPAETLVIEDGHIVEHTIRKP